MCLGGGGEGVVLAVRHDPVLSSMLANEVLDDRVVDKTCSEGFAELRRRLIVCLIEGRHRSKYLIDWGNSSQGAQTFRQVNKPW